MGEKSSLAMRGFRYSWLLHSSNSWTKQKVCVEKEEEERGREGGGGEKQNDLSQSI